MRTSPDTIIGGPVSTGTPIPGVVRPVHDSLWEEVARAHGAEEPIAESLSAHRLLRACAAEARRLASEATTLDATVAEALSNSARAGADASHISLLTASLQGLDRLCQEIDGLGRILFLITEIANCDGSVSGEQFAAAIKLGAQRRRLLVEGTLPADP